MSSRIVPVVTAIVALFVIPILGQQRVHVVMVSIDGLMPSTYTQAGPAKIPTLRRLVAEGAFAEGVIGVLPTITRPSHTTLITGVRPAVHGIVNNGIFDPHGLSNGAGFSYARDIRAPTLVGAARAAGLRTAAVNWPVSVGLDADFLIPVFQSSPHPEGLTLLRALSSPHLLDAFEISRRGPLSWPLTDDDHAGMTNFIIRTYQPHVTVSHFSDLDEAQHAFGPGSPEALEALEKLDTLVASILATLEAEKMSDQTYFALVSDHGFLPVQQQLRPNARFKTEGLLTTNAQGRVTDWQAYFYSAGGTGFVYLKNPADQTLRDRVRGILESIAGDPTNGVDRVWSAADLAGVGADPQALFGITMRRGFWTGAAHDTLLAPSTLKGMHGADPADPLLRSSLILRGPGIEKGGKLGTVRLTQIAPTLARLLGIGLSPQADAPLEVVARAAQVK